MKVFLNSMLHCIIQILLDSIQGLIGTFITLHQKSHWLEFLPGPMRGFWACPTRKRSQDTRERLLLLAGFLGAPPEELKEVAGESRGSGHLCLDCCTCDPDSDKQHWMYGWEIYIFPKKQFIWSISEQSDRSRFYLPHSRTQGGAFNITNPTRRPPICSSC